MYKIKVTAHAFVLSGIVDACMRRWRNPT